MTKGCKGAILSTRLTSFFVWSVTFLHEGRAPFRPSPPFFEVIMEFNKRKIYGRMILLSWGILLFWFLVKIIGGQGIEVVATSQSFINFMNYVDRSFVAKWIIGSLSSGFTISLLWLAMMGKKWFGGKREVKCLAVYLLVATALKVAVPIIGVLIDTATSVLIPLYIFKCDPKNVLWGNVYYFAFQVIAMFIKDLAFTDFVSNNLIVGILFLTDINIMMFLLYLYRVEGSEWAFWDFGGWANLKSSYCKCKMKLKLKLLKCRNSLKRLPQNWQSLTNSKVEQKLLFRQTLSYAVIFGCIGVFAYFAETIVESCILFVCYISLRYLFPTTFHTTPLRCVLISITAFCIALSNVIPTSTSLLSTVVVAFAFDWALWIYQDRLDMYAKQYEEQAKREEPLTAERLTEMFAKHKVKDKYREYLYCVLIDGMKDSEYFDKRLTYLDDPQQYRNFKSRFLKKIL